VPQISRERRGHAGHEHENPGAVAFAATDSIETDPLPKR